MLINFFVFPLLEGKYAVGSFQDPSALKKQKQAFELGFLFLLTCITF